MTKTLKKDNLVYTFKAIIFMFVLFLIKILYFNYNIKNPFIIIALCSALITVSISNLIFDIMALSQIGYTFNIQFSNINISKICFYISSSTFTLSIIFMLCSTIYILYNKRKEEEENNNIQNIYDNNKQKKIHCKNNLFNFLSTNGNYNYYVYNVNYNSLEFYEIDNLLLSDFMKTLNRFERALKRINLFIDKRDEYSIELINILMQFNLHIDYINNYYNFHLNYYNHIMNEKVYNEEFHNTLIKNMNIINEIASLI